MKIELRTPLRTLLAAALAASVAAGLGACASNRSASTGGSSETAGQYLDDATVTTKVKAALATDVGAKAATEIKVSTQGGVVQLSGFADSQDQVSRAVASAQKVSGVRSVKNDIQVR